ncbi:MAG: type transport system permease protein [Actinomycetota bacterium]|jgi:ABC-2 type transport system permease protein
MRAFLAGAGLEARIIRASPDALIPFFTSPLFTIIFLTIVRHGGRQDLQPDALMAPVLMTLWWFALFHGGNLVTGDRWQGVLEWILATPASLAAVIFGRIATIMVCGLFGFFEVWAVGKLVFGVSIPFEHPLALALTLLVTIFAMAGTAVVFAALFVLARNSYTFANSASFPFYVLGGVFVPIAILPGWIQPVTKGIFMSWSSDLLRASLKPPSIHDEWGRLGMIVLLGTLSFLAGRAVLAYVLRRMRTSGDLATA